MSNLSFMEKKILVVDDEITILNSVKNILSKFFSTVDIAENGESAFDLVKENDYDLILTDVNMPHMNGIELFNKLKELTPLQKIIFISAYGEIYFEKLGIDTTDLLIISKPLNVISLIEMLQDKVFKED